jgi:hypothetical protein
MVSLNGTNFVQLGSCVPIEMFVSNVDCCLNAFEAGNEIPQLETLISSALNVGLFISMLQSVIADHSGRTI